MGNQERKRDLGKKSTSRTHPSMKDKIYENIRNEIILFKLKPGEKISETQLAERYDVGLASVRAALPKLIHEGLIINRNRLGHQVSSITIKDILEVFQLRSVLEPEAAEMAVDNVDFRLLKNIVKKMKPNSKNKNRQPTLTTIMANRDFHIAIADGSGNKRLAKWIGQLIDFTIRYQYLTPESTKDGQTRYQSHDRIIEAFKKKDKQLARESMYEHILEGKEVHMAELIKLPGIQESSIGHPSHLS